jgi:tRNA(Ile)-lysidine synthase
MNSRERSVKTPWTSLHVRLHRCLRNRALLPSHQRILVAVSGGQDSLCLIQLLLDLQPKWNWDLAIAHCDHRWREDSAANAEHVASLARQWQIPYFCQTAVTSLANEAAARQWRYQALTEIAQSQPYATIVTGHTQSDRAETILHNLIRGCGLDGLQSLPWQRLLAPNIRLVRPLLMVSRSETAQFCHDRHLPIWEDSTNQNLSYTRNRIRHELIPYLAQHVNPQVEQHLAQTAELLQGDLAYLEATALPLYHQALHPLDTAAALHRPPLQTIPLALQRRVIRQFLQTRLAVAPSFQHVEKVVALLNAPDQSRSDPFPGGQIAQVDGAWLRLVNREPKLQPIAEPEPVEPERSPGLVVPPDSDPVPLKKPPNSGALE